MVDKKRDFAISAGDTVRIVDIRGSTDRLTRTLSARWQGKVGVVSDVQASINGQNAVCRVAFRDGHSIIVARHEIRKLRYRAGDEVVSLATQKRWTVGSVGLPDHDYVLENREGSPVLRCDDNQLE